jgi:hypothetical protein
MISQKRDMTSARTTSYCGGQLESPTQRLVLLVYELEITEIFDNRM